MTRRTNAAVAGFTYLFYIAAVAPTMALMSKAMAAESVAGKLAGLAVHAADVRLSIVLNLLGAFSALVLAVTLYAITRDEDRDLAIIALTCRVAEGIMGGVAVQRLLGLLWLATAGGPNVPEPAAARAIAAFLFGQRWSFDISGTFFAVGSTLFSWLLLRGRMIPAVLAWLGVLASALLVVALPLELTGVLHGSITGLIWLPMAAFEVPLGFWFLFKGVAAPRVRAVAAG